MVEVIILGDDSYIWDGDGVEEEGCYVIEDSFWDGDEVGGEFGEDIYDDEEEVVCVVSFVVGIVGEGNDVVVLCEGVYWGGGVEGGEYIIDVVSKDIVLNVGFVDVFVNFKLGYIICSGNVVNGFGGVDYVYSYDG